MHTHKGLILLECLENGSCILSHPCVFYVFWYLSFSLCSSVWSPRLDLVLIQVSTSLLYLDWFGNWRTKQWAIEKGGCQADRWHQEIWPRCCWAGQRCLSRWSTWLVVKLGMDHIRLAALLVLWTRGRCSGFDAAARRRSEGKDADLHVCICVCVCHLPSGSTMAPTVSVLNCCIEEKDTEFTFACRTN